MQRLKYAAFFCCLMFLMSCGTRQAKIPEHHIPPAIQPPASPTAVKPRKSSPAADCRQVIVQTAIQNIGRPYRWGGQHPGRGFDCSGLAFYAYARASIKIPRTSAEQLRRGMHTDRNNLLPGDLVFFKNPKFNKSIHVGILIKKNVFIHAPGKGRTVSQASLNNTYFQTNYIGARTFVQ